MNRDICDNIYYEILATVYASLTIFLMFVIFGRWSVNINYFS